MIDFMRALYHLYFTQLKTGHLHALKVVMFLFVSG
jgi:hypothetical protein